MDVKSATKPVKEKRRNNEKRKEKSRDAARCRRSRETEIFTELAECLPLAKEETDQLDKTSVMRLAISYLRVRAAAPQILPPSDDCKTSSMIEDEHFLLQALGGFLIMISPEGDIAYVSSNVTEYLGITQVDLMGQSIFDFSHPCDHDEIKEAASIKLNPTRDSRSMFPRMKCTLTSKGRNVNIKSASYKVIHCTGHIILSEKIQVDNLSENDNGTQPSGYFLAVARPIPHPSNIEIPLDSKTFLTKHNMKLKFTYVDDKMKELLGYDSEDLLDQSIFDCHHAGDSETLVSSFKCLISKGQSETPRYRFLCRYGGYAWVVTQSTVIYDKLTKPQSVVSVHYLISGVIDEHEIFSCAQLAASHTAVKVEHRAILAQSSSGDNNNNLDDKAAAFSDQHQHQQQLVSSLAAVTAVAAPVSVTAKIFGSLPDAESALLPLRTETATAKIFAPRTEEMNTGFLMFDEEVGKTVLKEEPDDLTHLAPTAGDVCIPLQPSPEGGVHGAFIAAADAFDEFILTTDTDAYLLAQDDTENDLNCASFEEDAFISYRDNDNTEDYLFGSSSPSLSKSPCSLPSLCSPGKSSFGVDDGGGGGVGPEYDDPLNAFETLDMECSMDTLGEDSKPIGGDLDIRAPYIPMTGMDDLPLLMSEDLMWGALPDHVDLHREQPIVTSQKDLSPIISAMPSVSPMPLELDSEEASALAQLLCADDDKKSIEFLDPSELFGATTPSQFKKCSWSTKMDKIMDLQIEAAMAKSPSFEAISMSNLISTRSRSMTTKRPSQQIGSQTANKRIRNSEKHVSHASRAQLAQSAKIEPKSMLLNDKQCETLGSNRQQRLDQIGQQSVKSELRTPSCTPDSRIANPQAINTALLGGTTNRNVNPTGLGTKQQPSDSVLMNLLVSGCDARLALRQIQIKDETELRNNTVADDLHCMDYAPKFGTNLTSGKRLDKHLDNEKYDTITHSVLKEHLLKEENSTSHTMLEPIPLLLDLSQIDYDMNTPVGPSLLNGSELITALDGSLLT